MGCPPVTGVSGGCRGYELAADLDFTGSPWASGAGWLPIGDLGPDDRAIYTGVFEGNGFVIANLHINRPSNNLVGLFDGIGYGGVVRGLGLPEADVTGRNSVGALSGLNSGTVLRSWSTGTVAAHGTPGRRAGRASTTPATSSARAGRTADGQRLRRRRRSGLAGRQRGHRPGQLRNRGRRRPPPAAATIGGLVGHNHDGGAITALLRHRSRRARRRPRDGTGGLVGHNEGSVTASYATGDPRGDRDRRGRGPGRAERGHHHRQLRHRRAEQRRLPHRRPGRECRRGLPDNRHNRQLLGHGPLPDRQPASARARPPPSSRNPRATPASMRTGTT